MQAVILVHFLPYNGNDVYNTNYTILLLIGNTDAAQQYQYYGSVSRVHALT